MFLLYTLYWLCNLFAAFEYPCGNGVVSSPAKWEG
jgi:hypothetical protein